MTTGRFDAYVSWPNSREDGVRTVVAQVRDHPTVADLLAFLTAEAPDVPLEDVVINGGHVRWQRPATPEEVAERVVWRQQAAAREEEWQRAALLRFLIKYGIPEEYDQ